MLSDPFSLKDRIIVITGAAGLLGRMHADAVAAFGGIPILLDLSADALEKVSVSLNARYSLSESHYVVDITSEAEVQRCCSLVLKKFGKIDALINNAANNPKVEGGGTGLVRLESYPLDHWDADLSVGLTGAFLCIKHFGSTIANTCNSGVILNIASDLALIAPDQGLYRQPSLAEDCQPVKPVSYSVTKSGLIGLTRYVATYWPDRLRCNALCPGGVQAGQSETFLARVNSKIPMGRLARIDEYQAAVVFLLSDASSYMNGAVIPIDGGRTVW
jgi:NAD(P)-dependent dehydrogenase (short-subunit alcohol dehydrogenase family)